MNLNVQGIAVEFDPKKLADYRNMKRLYSIMESGNLSGFDKWGVDIFGADQWERMLDEFAAQHDGLVPVVGWVEFINEIMRAAKDADETVKNS